MAESRDIYTRAATAPAAVCAEVTDRVTAIVLTESASRYWWYGFGVAALFTLAFIATIAAVFSIGVGLFGINIPVAWGFPIINTIWWIGIAHAGTLISGVLLLTRQPWRAPVARFAEGMALFAVVLAGTFPLLHLGRVLFVYYVIPYPNTMDLWPQWRSPLVWDFFAIGTYVIFTLIFLYMSLLPDLGTLRDRAVRLGLRGKQLFYGLLALGWRNDGQHWHRYDKANRILAGLSAPIVFAVTGTISLDLAVSIVPGYHFTIFPPYFVAGALFSGFATVVIIAAIVRNLFKLQDLVTAMHLDYIAKMMLLFALVVDYSYTCEIFTAFYSGEQLYREVYFQRWLGPYAIAYWGMIACNVVIPQLLWLPSMRRSWPSMVAIAIAADVGMWLERFVIVITSTSHDFMPSAWRVVMPTLTDWLVLFGSIGTFFLLLLLFVRLMPSIAIHDMRKMLHGLAVRKEDSSDA